MIPSVSEDNEPSNCAVPVPAEAETGEITITWSGPAFAVGGTLANASTVIFTSSAELELSSSVTVSLKTYSPCTRLLNFVFAAEESSRTEPAGPLLYSHKYVLIVPSGSVDVVPSRVTSFTG